MKEHARPPSQSRVARRVTVGLLLGLMLPLAAAVVYAYRFTDSTPATLSDCDLSPHEADALNERIRVFRRAVQSGQVVNPLELTGRDLNALVRSYTDVNRTPKVVFTITARGLEAHTTTTLGKLGLPVFKKRHVNASALLESSVHEGVLWVGVQELRIGGRRVPGWIERKLRARNLAAGLRENPRTTLMFERIEAIRVEGEKLVIVPRPE